MFKKIIYISFFLLLSNSNVYSKNNIYISATVNNEIITNFDIEVESQYLKILNPNLSNLENKKIYEIAKNSLINEIIKKNEIKKRLDVGQENQFVDEHLKKLYKNLNYNTQEDFVNSLKSKKNYSIEEIRNKIKIEILWNELIYLKYRNQLNIDTQSLKEKVDNLDNNILKEYLLSEIVFEPKKEKKIENLIDEIKLSISEIGFNNTANIFSISESSKLGGKIGWINVNNLSRAIYEKLKVINEGEITDTIKIGNNFLILKIEKIRDVKIELNKENELKKMIQFETNKQLNQFSRVFFNKSKLNYSINEN